MTDEIELTRRKVLAATGAIGAAGAGAGMSTTAYFSDEERFENNQLTAGELDLKVSYEEHYSDWSDDETEGLANPVYMEESEIPDDQVGQYLPFPTQNRPVLWVHRDDKPQFMDNTVVEELDLDVQKACAQPNVLPNDNPAERINLQDVKPGDFGEVTFDFAICGNPGYVWMTGGLESASENGLTEPEREDPDEDRNRVELLDEVQTCIWYDDDCDNYPDIEPEPYCLDLIIDNSGSMEDPIFTESDDDNTTIIKLDSAIKLGKDLVNTLDAQDQSGNNGILGPADTAGEPENNLVAVESFNADAQVKQDLTDKESDIIGGIDEINQTPGNLTDVAGALENAKATLDDCPDTHNPYVVLVTNAAPGAYADLDKDGEIERPKIESAAQSLKDKGVTVKIVTYKPNGKVDDGIDFWEDVASGPDEVYVIEEHRGEPTDDELQMEIMEAIEGIAGQVASTIVSEELVYCGTLRGATAVLSGESDILSSNVGIPLDGDRSTRARSCYQPEEKNCVGFAWWLPVDHANEIQTDSATFDLGFYTEQCRHNDGRRDGGGGDDTPDDGAGDGPAISFIAYCGPNVDSGTTVQHTVLERDQDGPTRIRWSASDAVATIRMKSGQLEEEFDVGGATQGTVEVGAGTELDVQDVGAFASDPCGWNGAGQTGVKYDWEGDEMDWDKDN